MFGYFLLPSILIKMSMLTLCGCCILLAGEYGRNVELYGMCPQPPEFLQVVYMPINVDNIQVMVIIWRLSA